MVRAITISREFGAGGETLARALAERLGWRLVDNSLIAELARAAQVNPALAERYDECVDSWFHRLFKSLWQGGFEGSATRVEGGLFDADAMARLWHATIAKAAEMGNCICVGRGGQCILQNRKDAFHVAVYAPLRDRMERIRDRFPAGADLRAQLAEVDQMRSTYIRNYFGQDWTNRHLYHLMICSSIGMDVAADAILCAAGLHAKKEP